MDKRGNGIAWDVENDFLAKYRALMERVKRGDQTAYYQVKELRAKEFRNTVEIVNQGYYVTENGNRFDFPDDSGMMCRTVFYEVMDEPEFRNRFRLIVFAILDDHNAHQKHNPEGNFKPFAEELAM